MARKRGLILIMLSMVVGLAAAWTANRWVDARTVDENETKGTRVVVAALAIPYATKVEARHVKYVQLPEDAAPAGAFTSIEDIEGRVSTTAVERGEILLAERFAEHESGSTLAALVSENMRAVTVRVNDVVGVAGFLLPGNRVDIVSARRVPGSRRAVAETILENIKVLAVDQTAATDKNEPVIVRAVTLEMTPKQTEKIVKARTEGDIQLTLRNPLDMNAAVEPEPEPEPKVVAKAEPKKVIRRPAPRPVQRDTTVEVIRGTKVDTKKTKT